MLNFYHVLTLIKGVRGVLEALRKESHLTLEKFLRTVKTRSFYGERCHREPWKTDVQLDCRQWLPGARARSLLQEVSGILDTSLNSSVDI